MNELKRAVVLLVALVNETLKGNTDPGLASIRKELGALTVLLTVQSRAAAGYHETPRGQALLEDGEQAVRGRPAATPEAFRQLELELEELRMLLDERGHHTSSSWAQDDLG